MTAAKAAAAPADEAADAVARFTSDVTVAMASAREQGQATLRFGGRELDLLNSQDGWALACGVDSALAMGRRALVSICRWGLPSLGHFPATVAVDDTVGRLRFCRRLPDPTPESVVQAVEDMLNQIEACLLWLERDPGQADAGRAPG